MENFVEISSLPKTGKQSIRLGNQNGGTVPGTAPALYVLVKQSTGKSDQGNLVSNQDDCGFPSSAAQPVSKAKTYLPAECTSGNVTVTLDNSNMWNEFYHRNTEMVLTKQGRRMFPYCRYWVRGLESNSKYILVMDISPVDNFRYKWNGNNWEPSGKAEPHVLGRVFIHPESPSTGYYWMRQPVSFYKLKVTNNTLDQEGHIILHSMHRYLPRLHLVPAEQATEVIQLNGPDVHTFTFPQTEFFAVTAYQNIQITQLKIDYNPFAKGFRDDGLSSRLQRDTKQNDRSEQEGGSVTSSPSNYKHPNEGDILDPEQRALDTSFHDMYNPDLERDLLSPYHDSLGFMETDIHGFDIPSLKQEASESPIASPCQNITCVASILQSNGDISAVVKEEPEDDYDYGPNVSVEGISVKQEDEDDISEDYLNSSDSLLEQQLTKHKQETESHKRPHDSQLGVARAKMSKLDSGKMPVVYLEPCAVTRNTVKVSTLSPVIVSSKSEQSSLSNSVEPFPTCFENSFIPNQFSAMKSKEITTGTQISADNVSQRCSLAGDILWENTETSSNFAEASKVPSCNIKTFAYSDPLLAKVNSTGKKINAIENISCKNIIGNKNLELPAPRKRGRPRKIKHLRVGRPSKCTGRLITTSGYASLGPDGNHLNVKPDLVDVDGVLFVSFASKEALDIHSVNRAEEKQLKNGQTASLTSCDHCVDPGNSEAYVGGQMIQQLEKELLEDLKSLKYRQVIHPSLREVGLKLNFVDPTMSIDLKYLGVQLPLSYSDDYTSWKNLRDSSTTSDAGLPFVSRTGKTNDFTKIKGWRGKLHSSSKSEGILIEGSLKNRSAFCSDKLDEYLENEGKLLETSMGLSPGTSSSPVVYQLPTKSTSYVRTLDSVLKKQSTVTTSSSCTLKSLSVPYVSKKKRQKLKNRKNAVSRSKEKSPAKSVISVGKEKGNVSNLEEKVTKTQPSRQGVNEVEALMVPTIEESMQAKHITVHQPQQSSRLPSLSKTHLKLMDLEDCALWDGKPRTYITEERADLSLTTLLTAQASLKNKPIHKIMKRRAPPCNNDFCRLGCICSSLSLEKRQPAHCRKPDCMFGCTCLKRKVVLVKGGSKKKKILEKPLQGRHMLPCGKKVDQQEQDIEKKKEEEKLNGKDKKKENMQYTFCDREPEKTVKNFPLWVKVDGELDPEPVYIPTPSVESTKPVTPPSLEVLPSDDKPPASEVKLVTGGVKSSRVYTPRPNPVIREEDKDPVYLYFESMMTCARIRVYTRKVQEKRQHQKCPPSSEEHIEKEHHPEVQPTKIEMDKEPGARSPVLNLASKSLGTSSPEVKNTGLSCGAENTSTSYVHHTTPDGITKLVEIISDCKWEEDRNEILNILSEHMKNKLPKSLEVGNFVIDLEAESKTCDEKNIPIYSSRVKISMLSSKNKSEKTQIAVSEPSDNSSSTCRKTEKKIPLTPAMLREQRKKGLPFYASLSPAGKLLAYPRKSGWSRSTLVQVNGKNYPQARLLLGQMGALHPASRLAAYLTGRLRPAMLDLSTISTVVSKVASSTKVSASESKSAEVPTSETSKIMLLDNTGLNSTVTSPSAHASTQRQIVSSTTGSITTVSTPTSPSGSVGSTSSGIHRSPLSNEKSGNMSPSSFSPGGEKRMGPRLLLIPVNPGSSNLRPQNMQLGQGKKMILQPIRNPGGTNLYRHPNGQIIQLVPLHQLQTTGSQTSLSPVMIRNSGSVVGIRFPTPTKPPETSVCPSSSDSVVTPTTTTAPVLSAISTFSELTTTETTSVLPGTLTNTPTSSLPSTTSTEDPSSCLSPAVVSTPPTIEAASLLSMPSTSDTPSLSISSSPTLVAPTAEGLSVVSSPSTSNAPLPPPIVSTSSPAEALSALSKPPTTESFAALSASNTTDAPFIPPTTDAHSVLPESTTTEGSSVLPVFPTSQDPSTLPESAATEEMGVPPVADVPVVLTVSSSATPVLCNTEVLSSLSTSTNNCTLKATTSVPACSVSATQTAPAISSLFVPGTLTLRISPSGIKSIPTQMSPESKIKCNCSGQPNSTGNLSLQSDSFALLQFPGKNIQNSIVKQVVHTEIKNDTFCAVKLDENVTCSQVKGTGESKENKRVDSQPESCSKYVKCDQNGAILQRANKYAEVNLQLSKDAAVSSDPIYVCENKKYEEKEVTIKSKHVKNPEDTEDKVSHSFETGPECGSQTAMNSTKIKTLMCGTQGLVQLQRNMKEKDNYVIAEKKREEQREKPKVNIVKVHDNTSANKNLDNGQKFLSKRNTGSQESDRTAGHNQEESQTTKRIQIGNLSRQLVALENKTNMDANKNAKYIRQNTLETSHHRKVSSPIIDITTDDSEKEEKTDDSADEMADEVSGYQSEDVNVETMDESESSGVEENVDIETVEELKEKFNIARLKSIAAHVAQSKQLHLVRDSSAQTTASAAKLSESSNKKPKNTEKGFSSYRQTHTANERRRRKEMRGLFENLKETLGLQSFPKVSKCFLLKQAFDEIQGLTDQADKLKGQKNLLMRKQETLIRKVSTLSGKTQEVVLKKLEYIYAKQKAVEEQKTKQNKQEKPTATCETTETAIASVEDSSSSPVKDMKPVIVSTRRTKPLILSRKGSYVTGDASSHMTLTNASLVMTANGQVLALKSPLVSGQFASFPLQTELKSEMDSTNGTTQPGVASVMIQLPSSAVQVKGIFPAATLPIALSSVAGNTATAIVQKTPELTSENEDSFMMPRIVNVTSLATKEDASLNPDINKNSRVTLQADSQEKEPSFQVVSQETTKFLSEEKRQASSGKGQNATRTAQDFLGRKGSFPQIVSVSSLKGSSASYTTEVNVEEFSGIKKRVKLTGKGNDCQMSNNSTFQKVPVPRNSGLETELQKVASAIHESALDANDLIDVESDDTDETLTSLLNEIAFLNQQLNDDVSDMSELPNSLSSGFSLKDMESRQESVTTCASSFQFGAVDRSFKDPSGVRESSGSITPLLLHLSDDDLPEGNRNSGEASVQSDTLIMLGSEVKNSHPDLRTVNRDGSRKNVGSLTRTRSVSPPILQMKTNLDASTSDMTWRPMPKLAPLGLKTVTFSLDSEGHNTKTMPLLAPVTAKEMKTTEPMSGPNLDPKAVVMLTSAAKKSK